VSLFFSVLVHLHLPFFILLRVGDEELLFLPPRGFPLVFSGVVFVGSWRSCYLSRRLSLPFSFEVVMAPLLCLISL